MALTKLNNGESMASIRGKVNTAFDSVDSLQSSVDKMNTVRTATISTTWIGSSAPYTQTVSVSGITANDKPIISPIYSADTATAKSQIEAWNMISKIETDTNKLNIVCFYDKPTQSIQIQIKGG